MPWKVISPMSQRREFVSFAMQPDANISDLCRKFEVSRKAAYKWLDRYRSGGEEALADRSRRPLHSPKRTDAATEQQIIELRQQHPAWGARKLKRRLEDLRHPMPARSTVNGILRRHGLIDTAASKQHQPMHRFERTMPNELWQMDFKGHFATDGGRCHPLTMLDDCSRFNLLLRACANETFGVVQQALIDVMRRYGMPRAILADNGTPWGDCNRGENLTALEAWLLRHGVSVLHGAAGHPQTQGKEERFHRTLKAEAIGTRRFADHAHCQRVFDAWRDTYNQERPHEALAMAVPGSRYQPSPRAYPEAPPPIEYASGDVVRRVCAAGKISYHNRSFRVGRALVGQPVAIRPTRTDGLLEVFYCHQCVAKIDLRATGGES